jgi:hypothetical protein
VAVYRSEEGNHLEVPDLLLNRWQTSEEEVPQGDVVAHPLEALLEEELPEVAAVAEEVEEEVVVARKRRRVCELVNSLY